MAGSKQAEVAAGSSPAEVADRRAVAGSRPEAAGSRAVAGSRVAAAVGTPAVGDKAAAPAAAGSWEAPVVGIALNCPVAVRAGAGTQAGNRAPVAPARRPSMSSPRGPQEEMHPLRTNAKAWALTSTFA